MSEHHIIIKVDGQQRPIPFNSKNPNVVEEVHKVRTGDKMKWTSPEGRVEVVFTSRSPLDGGNGGEQFRAVRSDASGVFRYKCTVIDRNGKRFGWPDTDSGGGSVEVLPLR